MPKRRRERDKPKAGPEALYNPNKRVLLSYASDEEEEIEEEEKTLPAAKEVEREIVEMRRAGGADLEEKEEEEEDLDAQGDLSGYQIAEYPEEEEGGSEDGGQRVEGEEEEEEEEFRDSTTDDWTKTKKRDPVTNQFPSLGPPPPDEDEDEEEYNPETEEAMAYLRAVRSERHTIPDILFATYQMQADADQVEGAAGEKSLPTPPMASEPTMSSEKTHEDDNVDPQKVYTRNLLDRFYGQRTQLHMPPTADQLAALTDAHPISFPSDNIPAFHEWQRILSTSPPQPTQLRCMEQDTVINLLGLVQRHHVVKNHDIGAVASAWIWSLLTRLDDVGTMTNDQVFPLRELGKKALLVLLAWKSPGVAKQLEATIGMKSDESSASPAAEDDQIVPGADVTRDSKRDVEVTAEKGEVPASENTLATLDMILVVVGEVFGQKDLLECRLPWTAAVPTTVAG